MCKSLAIDLRRELEKAFGEIALDLGLGRGLNAVDKLSFKVGNNLILILKR